MNILYQALFTVSFIQVQVACYIWSESSWKWLFAGMASGLSAFFVALVWSDQNDPSK